MYLHQQETLLETVSQGNVAAVMLVVEINAWIDLTLSLRRSLLIVTRLTNVLHILLSYTPLMFTQQFPPRGHASSEENMVANHRCNRRIIFQCHNSNLDKQSTVLFTSW